MASAWIEMLVGNKLNLSDRDLRPIRRVSVRLWKGH